MVSSYVQAPLASRSELARGGGADRSGRRGSGAAWAPRGRAVGAPWCGVRRGPDRFVFIIGKFRDLGGVTTGSTRSNSSYGSGFTAFESRGG